MRVRAVVVLLVALAACPAAALGAGSSTNGAGNALSPGLPASPNSVPSTTTTAPQVTTTGSSSNSSGLSGTNAVVIVIGALVVITAISLFIWRDARRRAPVRATAGGLADAGRRSGSKQRAKPRKLSPAERRRRKRGRARR